MPKHVDFSSLVPIEAASGDNQKDTELLRQMAEEARRYLLSHDWCKGIQRGWLGRGIGGIVAVFLFELIPTSEDVDDVLWVVVGDVPPAYLVVAENDTPDQALRRYVGLMQQWVDAVRNDESTKDYIPVNAPPSLQSAEALQTRLDFLRQEWASPD